jgi:sugar phosphate isomerase/epimerase
MTSDDIVSVHVNDAPPGIAIEDQLDGVRRLPMETGVIDLPAIMRRLAQIGYDGPVIPEPFSERINAIARDEPERAARLTSEAMDLLWHASDLG